MSRIGRLPVVIPAGVDVTIDGRAVSIRGPKGKLSLEVAEPIEVNHSDGIITVTRPNDEGKVRALHGLSRTLVANMVTGVTEGFDKQQVGEVAANIRKLRKPDPYKGKGVRYAGEQIRRKVGKAGK